MFIKIRLRPKMRRKMQNKTMACGGFNVGAEYIEVDINPKFLEGAGPKHWMEWEEIDAITKPAQLTPAEEMASLKIHEAIELVGAAADFDELDGLEKAELEGKGRKGVLSAIAEGRVKMAETPIL